MRVLVLLLCGLQAVLSCMGGGEEVRTRRSLRTNNPSTDLYRDLLDGYNKDVIPMLAPADKDKNAVIVNFGLNVISIDMDEDSAVLTTTAWVQHSWMDTRLEWDPEMYGGITAIRVPTDYLWRPDFEVYNSVNFGPGSFAQQYANGQTLAIVYSSGFVLHIPPVNIKTLCSKNTEDFGCQFKIGSWTYDGYHINPVGFDNKTYLGLDSFSARSPYIITSQEGNARQNSFYPCCEEPYPNMSYNFTVRRNAADALPGPVEEYYAAYQTALQDLTQEEADRLRGY